MKLALFNSLAAEIGDSSVLDLFAGSGSFGLEALSRGAARATFVEKDAAAVAALQENVDRLGVDAVVTIVKADVYRLGEGVVLPGGSFDVVFLDPPFAHMVSPVGRGRLGKLLDRLVAGGIVADDASVVLHLPAGAFQDDMFRLLRVDKRKVYGINELAFLRPRPETRGMAGDS